MSGELAEIEETVHFGAAGAALPEWRENAAADEDPDDEDAPCPADVKLILGFDPDENG
jgi:hypothetical protein